MRLYEVFLAFWLVRSVCAKPVDVDGSLQVPLEDSNAEENLQKAPPKRLHGRFLHITDLHPDPHYKPYSSTDEDDACHRGKGSAGPYGGETTDCDTPWTLIDATFKWIDENIRDTIDFVVWTGDSARHDSDEKIPRKESEILDTNRKVADKFLEVFGKDTEKNPKIPVVPTFGNNDILPHNILLSGPNKWLKFYQDIWHKFIPEEQRHGFERGGWFYREVIPNKLAVFSLNTLYFFTNNAAVDGCAYRSEPGYQHMEWLRIQLQFMRRRGMKAILIGHVPPARTKGKQLWDESCWQRYTLWLQQYRDMVVGGFYGHMNIDHFMLQDTKEVELVTTTNTTKEQNVRTSLEDDLTIESKSDYLVELRDSWSELPKLPKKSANDLESSDGWSKESKKGKKHKKKKKPVKKIGSPWGERYQVSLVGPSVVPNFFPTLRVIEYNISGLNEMATEDDAEQRNIILDEANFVPEDLDNDASYEESEVSTAKKHKKKHKKHKRPDVTTPHGPSKHSPPGPAYSPQTFTLLGYTQYFANLTWINDVDSNDSNNKAFQYQVEYDTFTDPIYKLKDLTVRSWLKLAHRIGKFKPEKGDQIADDRSDDLDDAGTDEEKNEADASKNKGKKHKKYKKKKDQAEKNRAWLRFVKWAFVGTMSEKKISKKFGTQEVSSTDDLPFEEAHDGDL